MIDLHFHSNSDLPLVEVATELRRLDPQGFRWASVIRRSYDMIYNGQETGRYRWDQLMKTEKTHFGTLFEINAQREFGFEDGDQTDFRIAGHQVDAKWSQTEGAWMLPPEVVGHIALVASASDSDSTWSLGLVRVTEAILRTSVNRDAKRQLNADGRASVAYLWKSASLRPNVLLQLPRETVDRIMALRHGTQRTNALFREAEGMIVHRSAVATVSRQLDAQRRVRDNGGARQALQPEGYVILSGMYDRALAEALGTPVPLADEYVSVRVVPSQPGEGALIDGTWWRRARSSDSVIKAAPYVHHPRQRKA